MNNKLGLSDVSVKKVFFLLFMICSFSQLMAQISWSSPVTISASMTDNSSEAQVVVDPFGNATAAWVENGFIKASFQPSMGSWGTPSVLSSSGASSPVLGVDGSGNVNAIWVSSSGVIQLATLPLNGSWSAASNVSSAGATTPSLAVDAAGDVVMVWERSGYIEATTKLFGGLLSLVSQISPTNSSNPNVAIGAGGRVVAVWATVLVSGATTVESATQSGIGGTWTSSVNILPAPSAFTMNYPKVSVDQDGNADVLWYRYEVTAGVYSNVYVYSSSLPSGSSSWSLPIQISDTGLGNPANLFINITTDASGNKIAIWTISEDGQTYSVESAVKAFGGNWNPSNNAIIGLNLYAFQGSLASDSLGNAVATYMMFDGTNVNIQAAEASTAGIFGLNWSSVATISTGSENGYPSVASSYDSTSQTTNAAAVWITYNGTNTTVQAVSGSKVPISPPSNLAVTQNSTNFGVFTDYYNTVTWSASTDPNLALYAIFSNGNLIGEVGPSTLQFVDHNQVQNGSVTYGVAAVDNDLFLSQVETVVLP